MAALDSRLKQFKLETTFHDGHVIHTTYPTDLATQQREVAVKSKWIEKEKIEARGPSAVTLEENEEGQLRAVKSLNKDFYPTNFIKELRIMIHLRNYQHLFVLIFGWYEDQDFTYIAIEYIEYGDLDQHLRTPGPRFNAREIARQLLEGLAVLHNMSTRHGALNPKKVLIASIQPICVKITGFEDSENWAGTALRTLGSAGYTAPEVLGLLPRKHRTPERPHNRDMWSFGCILHEILTSRAPFLKPDSLIFTPAVDIVTLYSFCQDRLDLPVEILRQAQVSENGVAFIQSLLAANPSSRTSAEEALRSPWLLEDDTKINKNYAEYRGRLFDLRKAAQNTVPTANDSYSNPHKLKAIVHNDYVIETTYDPVANVASSAKWVEKKWLGSGGYGIVTLQEKEGGGQLRAVKKVAREMGKANRSQELKALSKLMDCPQDLFLQFFGWYENEYFTFIVTEYIEHGDLSQYLKSNPEAKSNAKEINRQLLEGLAILHEKKICHQDLKPQNILIASSEPIRVKIADFGGSEHEEGTKLETRIGTPSYCAPEILGLLPHTGTRYTNAVDMWALGCLAHETLTLQIPFLEPTDAWYGGQATSGISAIRPSPQTSWLFC